ncbi:MAG: hypothetical protein ABI175_07560 [Polyangiales bacterium]
MSAEIGGGATLMYGGLGDRVLPHGLAGLRFGFAFRDKDGPQNVWFGFELLLRAIVVPEGAGFGFGLGMQWGQ